VTPAIVFAAIVLFASAVFNLVTWPRFYVRINKDPRARDSNGKRTAFYKAHLVLLIIAEALAVAALFAGVALLSS